MGGSQRTAGGTPPAPRERKGGDVGRELGALAGEALVRRALAELRDEATGQVRSTDQLLDLQFRQPGTVTVALEPIYEGGLAGVVPGSSCIADAYTSSHDALDDPNMSTGRYVVLHAVDALGLVHAILLRIQALLLPFKTLVLNGGH